MVLCPRPKQKEVDMEPSDSVDLMLRPSNARILRIEISNPGLPASLTDLITSRKANSFACELLYRRQLFQEEHDQAVRTFLGVPKEDPSTFVKYYREYIALKGKYVRNVLGYGNFMLSKDLPEFLVEAEAFKKELDDLRLKVRCFMNDKLNLPWKDILRFNPRLKYATFLLSESLVRDEDFRWHVANMREPFRESQDVDDLLGLEV